MHGLCSKDQLRTTYHRADTVRFHDIPQHKQHAHGQQWAKLCSDNASKDTRMWQERTPHHIGKVVYTLVASHLDQF